MGDYPLDENYSDESFIVQMKDMRMVSRNIAHYYLITAPYLARAGQLCYSGNDVELKQLENQNRSKVIEYFSTLVIMSFQLPKVQELIEKEEYKFKDGVDLLTKLWTVDQTGITSSEIVKWWFDYSKVLVAAGLVQAYDMRDTDKGSFRRY